MKRTEFIKLAMRDLLIPSVDYHNLFPNGLESCDKGNESFFDLQTFPHIGDMVIGVHSIRRLFKVKSITWVNNNEVMIASKNEVHYPINRVYPICITNEMLIRLGFYWDERFHKFRLRLKGFRNIDIEKHESEVLCYIKEIGFIKYLHELQAVLRIYNIDKGILDNRLRIGEGLSKIGLIYKMYE